MGLPSKMKKEYWKDGHGRLAFGETQDQYANLPTIQLYLVPETGKPFEHFLTVKDVVALRNALNEFLSDKMPHPEI